MSPRYSNSAMSDVAKLLCLGNTDLIHLNKTNKGSCEIKAEATESLGNITIDLSFRAC
jgi:hypothetical protein